MPVTIHGHCTFKINSTHGLITGGAPRTDPASTWFVDLATTTFAPGPIMNVERFAHGCAAVHSGSKTYGIVIGGEAGLFWSDSTEIIDLGQNSPAWIEGMPERWRNSLQ